MGKNNNYDVRGHSQEREWLQNLGGGSLVDGVRNLIENMKDQHGSDDYYYYSKGNRRNLLKWRDS